MTLDLWLFVLTLPGIVLGCLSISWARGDHWHARTRWGRRLSVISLLLLGALGLVAATHRAGVLPPLGLLAGLLVVALVWEGPQPDIQRDGK